MSQNKQAKAEVSAARSQPQGFGNTRGCDASQARSEDKTAMPGPGMTIKLGAMLIIALAILATMQEVR